MPIPIPTAIVVYFTIWWIVLFAVLPWGVRSQEEAGDVAPGSDRGAPEAPRLALKVVCTTVIAAAVFGLVMLLFTYFG